MSLLFALCLAPGGAFAGELEDLLARNDEAIGGSGNWAKIENVRVRLTLSLIHI